MGNIEWRPIRWASGYQVSNTGVVKNPKGKLIFGSDKDGYVRICVGYKLVRAHRLVAEAFLENSKGLPEVNHKDGNKKNNHVDNLEWSCRINNMRHAFRTRLCKVRSGENSPRAILKQAEVDFIKANYIKGHPEFGQTALGKKFGVTNSTVWRLLHGDSW